MMADRSNKFPICKLVHLSTKCKPYFHKSFPHLFEFVSLFTSSISFSFLRRINTNSAASSPCSTYTHKMNKSEQQIPPGYRFFPTEEELVSFYLRNKLANAREGEIEQVIPTVNLYYLDPWQLLPFASVGQDSEQWFFFCPQQEREAHGGRPARTTPSGYWKATGSPGPVYSGANKLIGVKKSMVFYEGKAPRGTKTKWKMNEYRALDETVVSGGSPMLRSEFSLCRVYKNSGSMRAFDRRPLMDAAAVPEHSRLGSEDRNDDNSSLDASLEELNEDIKLIQEMDWEDWL